MKLLFLSHQGAFDRLAEALSEHAGVECCLWMKCREGCPMPEPDAVILDSLSMCLTYEEEAAMGITSRPMRCVYMFASLRGKGGPMALDWRMFMFNERFLTPAMCDQEDFDEEIDRLGLGDEKIVFDYLPLFTADYVSRCPERVGFDYSSDPFTVGQSIQLLTNKNSTLVKRACKAEGARFDLAYGLGAEALQARRAGFHMSFDQVRRGNIGRSCLETMSHGIPTMCWVKPSTMDGLRELGGGDFPVVNVRDLQSVQFAIRAFMEDRDALAKVGREQAEWMRTWYCARSIAAFWKAKMQKMLEERA